MHSHNYGAITMDEIEADESMVAQKAAAAARESHESRDQVTIIANTLNALLGVALFAMPWGFQQSGVLGGCIVLLLVALLSYETARMLLVAQKVFFQQTGEVKGYPEIASAALGHVWHYVVQVTTVISCLGGCTGYIIFFGQTLGQAFNMTAEKVILVATIPLVLLSWIRSFHELTFVTVFGVIALVLSVIILLLDGSRSMEHIEETPIIEFNTIFNFVGSATFLFTIHYCVLSIGAESLRNKPWLVLSSESNVGNASSFARLEKSIASSYFLAFIVIFIVGCGCYVMYRTAPLVRDPHGNIVGGCEQPVCQNVILNISPGLLRNIVGVTMSMVIMFSYLVILAPAREHIENAMLSFVNPKSDLSKNISQNILRTVLVLANIIVAIKAPYFGNMLSAVGGLTDAFLCFVMPPLIYRVATKGNISPVASALCVVLAVWGFVVIFYTLYHVVQLSIQVIVVMTVGLALVLWTTEHFLARYYYLPEGGKMV